MNSKLRELVDAVNRSSDYEIKYVISWGYCGTVDSELYNSYKSASQNLDKKNNSILPVIVELNEEDKQKRKRKLAQKCLKSTRQ